MCEVVVERGEDFRRVERQLLQPLVEIEQVARFPALKECPKLGPEQLLGFERGDGTCR